MVSKKKQVTLKRRQILHAIRKGTRKATILLATMSLTVRETAALTGLLQSLADEQKKLHVNLESEDVRLEHLIKSPMMRKSLAQISNVSTVYELTMCHPVLLRKGLQGSRSPLIKAVLLDMQTSVALAVVNTRKLPNKKKEMAFE